MRQSITDTHLQAAAVRHHSGDTLQQIATDMGFNYNTLKSAKCRRSQVWWDAVASVASARGASNDTPLGSSLVHQMMRFNNSVPRINNCGLT